MVFYKPIKVIIDAPILAEMIINVVVWHHGLFNSMITNQGLVITSKFWSSPWYFFEIKWRLLTTLHLWADSQTKWQNSIKKAYLWAYINFEEDVWVRLLLMAKFVNNNVKNIRTGHTSFKPNYYGYHLLASYEENVNPCF